MVNVVSLRSAAAGEGEEPVLLRSLVCSPKRALLKNALLGCLCLVLASSVLLQQQSSRQLLASADAVPPPPRKILIDLGANCGNSYLILKTKTRLLSNQDDSNNDIPWDVYLWEANPQLVRLYLNDLQAGRTEHDTGTDRIHVMEAAATTQDTEMQFYLTKGQEGATTRDQFKNGDCNIAQGQNPAGASSILKQARMAGTPVTVAAFDFAKWLHEMNLRDDDRLLVKMDIEGAEVDLLEHMMAVPEYQRDLCRVERFMVEWHSFIFVHDPALKSKQEQFAETFPAKLQELCGREIPLKKWH